MPSHHNRVLAGIGACALLAAGVTGAIAHDGEDHHSGSGETSALEGYTAERNVTVRDRGTGEVVGMAMVRQTGEDVVAKITVAGLEPGSTHANHLHGEAAGEPAKGCFASGGHSTRHIHDLPDITANSAGVGYAMHRFEVDERVVRPGVFWMVHAMPTTGGHGGGSAGHAGHSMSGSGHGVNPGIACAPIA